MAKVNPARPVPFRCPGAALPDSGSYRLDMETSALVQRWIIAFCEPPVLIDAELMRRVLDEVEGSAKAPEP